MSTLDQEINRRIMSDPNLVRLINNIMPRAPRYRYFTRSGSRDRYFYTTEKISHKGGKKYVAGVYRFLKTRRAFKLVKRVGFARRFKAKDWALAMKNKEQSPAI